MGFYHGLLWSAPWYAMWNFPWHAVGLAMVCRGLCRGSRAVVCHNSCHAAMACRGMPWVAAGTVAACHCTAISTAAARYGMPPIKQKDNVHPYFLALSPAGHEEGARVHYTRQEVQVWAPAGLRGAHSGCLTSRRSGSFGEIAFHRVRAKRDDGNPHK